MSAYGQVMASFGVCTECETEYQAKIQECGGEQNVINWSEETCSGECAPCTANLSEGQETYSEAAARCTALDKSVSYFDEEICRGICDTCTEEQYLEVKNSCGQLAYNFSEVTCDGDCDFECDQEWAKAQAQSYCPSGTEVVGYSCESTPENGHVVPQGSVTCLAPNVTIYPKESDPGAEKPDDPETPPSTAPAADPTDPSDSNQWNAAIKQNQDSQIQQNDSQLAKLNEQNKLLEWIGENAKRTTDNTKALTEAVQDGLGEIDDELEGIKEGAFTPPGEEDPYAPEEEYDFATRTSQFLNNMKSTGLFSIPNTLSQSIPGGGTSTLTISTGETFGGDHTIDFNWLSSGLTILKYLFQIAGMALAIRIVTLKR